MASVINTVLGFSFKNGVLGTVVGNLKDIKTAAVSVSGLIGAIFEHEEKKKSNKVQFILVAALANVINSPNFILNFQKS